MVSEAWTKGYRLGVQGSSDHLLVHTAYAMLLVEKNSRQGLIDAIGPRHSYGATDSIIVDFRLVEDRPVHDGPPHVGPAQVRPGEVDSPHVQPPQIVVAQVRPVPFAASGPHPDLVLADDPAQLAGALYVDDLAGDDIREQLQGSSRAHGVLLRRFRIGGLGVQEAFGGVQYTCAVRRRSGSLIPDR